MFFETINTIKSLRAEIAELSAMEKRLSAPLLQDYSDIPKVLALYENLTGASCSGGSWAVVANRKKFIFVAVFLFAPLMMLGGSMPRRLRAELGRALGVSRSLPSLTIGRMRFSITIIIEISRRRLRE